MLGGPGWLDVPKPKKKTLGVQEENKVDKKTTGNKKTARPRHKPHPDVMFYPIAKSQNERTGDSLHIKCFKYEPSRLGLSGDTAFLRATKDGYFNGSKELTKKGDFLQDKDNNVAKTFMPGTARISNTGASNNLTKRIYDITLPIPQDINDSNTVTWGDDNMNIFQLAGLSAANMVMEQGLDFNAARDFVVKGLFGKNEDGNNSFGGVDPATQNAVRAAISGKAINMLGQQITPNSAIGRAEGMILNSNLELLFSGVNLRSFPFSVNFSPRSPDEARMVKHIIRALKSSMAAKKNTSLGEAPDQGGVFLRAPDVFKLEYLHNGTLHPFLNQFKACALTGMTVNYTNAGTYTTYGEGTPVSLKMNLTFKELNPIYHEDYDEFEENDHKGVGF